MSEPALRRQIAKCVHDFKIAFGRVREGIRIWSEAKGRTFGNYMVYTDAADATVDKMRFAEALLNHYAEVRTGHQQEIDYENGFREFVNDNLGPSTNSVNDWFTTTAEYVEEQWKLEDAEGDPNNSEAKAAVGTDHDSYEMITDEDEVQETTDQLDDEDNESHVDEAAEETTDQLDNEDNESHADEAAPADDEIEEIIDVLENENEEDDKVGKVPANTPNTSAPPAEHDSEEMVTDKDLEDILDAEEDENKEDDTREADEKGDNGEKKCRKDDGEEATTEEPAKPAKGKKQKELVTAKDTEVTVGNQEHLLPYCLSLQDGAADLPIWVRKVRTYFLVKKLSKQEPEVQWAALSSLLDDDTKKALEQEIELTEKQPNLENMLAALQNVFDEVFPRCVRCGETEDYQRNPHDLNNRDCLAGEADDEEDEDEDDKKGKGAEEEKEAAEEGKKEEEKKTTDAKDGKKETNNVTTGSVDLIGPDHNDPSSGIILHKKNMAVIILAQGENFIPTRALADTGSPFSIMWKGFAKLNNINFVENNSILERFQLVDISTTTIKVCGYVDIQFNTVDGIIEERPYQKTRFLIVDDDESTNVILGLRDLQQAHIIGDNFPCPMEDIATAVERRARAKILLEVEAEDGPRRDNMSDEEESDNPAVNVMNLNEWQKTKEVVKKAKIKMNQLQPGDGNEDKMMDANVAYRVAKYLLAEETYTVTEREKNDGLFLYRADIGGPEGDQVPLVNDELINGEEGKIAKEKEKMEDFDMLRSKLLKYGLQQIIYIQQVFNMTTAELVETIVRENENLGTFPDNNGKEIFGYMMEECSSGCKDIKKLGNIELCSTCKRRKGIIADLAVGLVKEMETAEIELKKGQGKQYELYQSKSNTGPASTASRGEKYSAVKDLGPHILQLGQLTKAGQEDICNRIDQLHALIKKSFKPQHAGGGSGGHSGRVETHVRQIARVPHTGANGGNPGDPDHSTGGANVSKVATDKKKGGKRGQKDPAGGGDDEAHGHGREMN